MGYLFCALALMMGVTKGFCGKKTSGTITTLSATMLFNAVRMLLCIPIGLLLVLLYTGTLTSLRVDWLTLLIALISGVATSVFVVTWIGAVRTGAYMMVDVFLTLGVSVPIALCRIFFKEEIRWNHILGILLLLVATYVMCTYNNKVGKARLSTASLLLLSLCGLSNGLTSFTQKWFLNASDAATSVFNLYTYVVSSCVLLLCFAAVQYKGKRGNVTGASAPFKKRLIAYVVIMSVSLFLYSMFSTMAGDYLTSAEIYPLMQGGALVLSMLMSALFFGERITPRCIVGILITFVALLSINLL